MSTSILLEDIFANGLRLVRNARRGWGRHAPDYVRIELRGSLPERAPPPQPWWQRLAGFERPALSIEALNDAFDLIAETPRVRGAILHIGALEAGLARVQNVRAAIDRFRRRGKRVVAYLSQLDSPSYLVACAADEIIAPESSEFDVRGLAVGAYYLKDALETYGIEVQAEAVGEYKTGPDPFRRSSMSEAEREMLDAILDSFFEDVVAAIAEGRRLSPEQARRIIDDAPMPASEAREAGLIDALLYEDELAGHLAASGRKARIETHAAARPRLRLPVRWRHPGKVGVVSVEGTIVPGTSRRYPLPQIPLLNPIAGCDAVTQALRRAERDRRIAAVVLYVNSPGGYELASDLIWREVARVGRRKPVVAYMGNIAGSGGYYVAVAAQHIVAQAATQTGSIGNFFLKAAVKGLLSKAQVQHEYLARGRRALLSHPGLPWSEEDQEKMRALAQHFYAIFRSRVAEGRGMSDDEVERVARGRVWTGKQALERGLIDALGDFEVAVRKAKELSGIPPDRCVPVVAVTAPRRLTLPLPFQEGNGGPAHLLGGAGNLLRGGVWAVVPWELRLRW